MRINRKNMKISNDMTMEEIITALAEEYGEDFNWSLIPETNNYYIKELKKSLELTIRCFSIQSAL